MQYELVFEMKRLYTVVFPFVYSLIVYCFLSNRFESPVIKSILLVLAFLTYDIFVNILLREPLIV